MITTLCYIDPASTALIWQVLAGIFISLSVILGVFWRKITTFFKSMWVKLFRKNKNQEEEKVVDESVLEIEDDLKDESKNDSNAVENNNEVDNKNDNEQIAENEKVESNEATDSQEKLDK